MGDTFFMRNKARCSKVMTKHHIKDNNLKTEGIGKPVSITHKHYNIYGFRTIS